MNISEKLNHLAHQARLVGEALASRECMLVTAESCTGGWLAEAITSVEGSSHWFERGFVTYSNRSKQEMLGVKAEVLERHGAVSEEAVREMAQGALDNSPAHLSVAITGVAGPSGGHTGKPIGTVWLAWAGPGELLESRCMHFDGDRQAVRCQAVICALEGILGVLGQQG